MRKRTSLESLSASSPTLCILTQPLIYLLLSGYSVSIFSSCSAVSYTYSLRTSHSAFYQNLTLRANAIFLLCSGKKIPQETLTALLIALASTKHSG